MEPSAINEAAALPRGNDKIWSILSHLSSLMGVGIILPLVVYLAMKGACAGCPSSTATLKSGIQNLLKHFLPDVQAVEQV